MPSEDRWSPAFAEAPNGEVCRGSRPQGNVIPPRRSVGFLRDTLPFLLGGRRGTGPDPPKPRPKTSVLERGERLGSCPRILPGLRCGGKTGVRRCGALGRCGRAFQIPNVRDTIVCVVRHESALTAGRARLYGSSLESRLASVQSFSARDVRGGGSRPPSPLVPTVGVAGPASRSRKSSGRPVP